MVLGVLPLLYFFRMYDYFMKEDPEKLRSDHLRSERNTYRLLRKREGLLCQKKRSTSLRMNPLHPNKNSSKTATVARNNGRYYVGVPDRL